MDCGQISITAAGRELVWQDWNDVYVVFQPSSTETHVFNETTAVALRLLQSTPVELEELRILTAQSLGVAIEELLQENLTFVIRRLEELGLVECSEQALPG